MTDVILKSLGALNVQEDKALNLNLRDPRDTGPVPLGHLAGQTGVYLPVSQGVPVVYNRKKLEEKGGFAENTRVFQGHPAIQRVFKNFM